MRRPAQLASESTAICASPLSQAIATEFVTGQDFRRTVASAAAVYGERSRALRTAMTDRLPPGATMTEPDGGFFTWVRLPEGWTTDALLDVAIDEGVIFVPGAAFCAPGEGERELRLAFSIEPPERLAEGATRLGRAVAGLADTL